MNKLRDEKEQVENRFYKWRHGGGRMRTREEILENNLSDKNFGDRVFHARKGNIDVTSVIKKAKYCIETTHGYFSISGRITEEDEYPLIFKSLDHCIEYFQEIKKIEEEKNVWTWEKIQSCEKIEFGVRLKPTSDREYIIQEKRRDEIKAISPNSVKCFSGLLNWEFAAFYDRSGNPIDPKEY